jgi:CHAT domain-containing protein/tetratricopeptide (TPR) repeat protein
LKAVSLFQMKLQTPRRMLAGLASVAILIGSTTFGAAEAQVNQPQTETIFQPAGSAQPTAAPTPSKPAGFAAPAPKASPATAALNGLTLPGGIKADEVKIVPAGSNPITQIPNFEIPQTPETIEKVDKFEAEGEKWFSKRMMDKALEAWQQAYGLSMEMKYIEGQGRSLTDMCRVYIERGEFTKAKYMGENAIEVLAQSSDKKALGRARIQLARTYFGLDNAVWAGQQLDEALKILTSSDVYSNSSEAAEALMLAGSVLVKIKKLKEALQFYEAAANYYAQASDQPRAVGTRVTIASFMDEFGFYTAALEEANKAISVARSAPQDIATNVAALAALGMAQYDMCEYANARKSYEDALRLVQKVKIEEVPLGPRTYVDLGYGCSLAATGDLDMAKQVIERTLTPLKQIGSTHGQATALNVLGTIEALQGQNAKAIAYFQQSLDMQNIITPRQPKLNIIVLQNMAAAESRSGDNRNAKMHLGFAFQLLKNFKSGLLEARTSSSLAEVYLKLSNPEKAQEFVKHAIEVGEKVSDDASLWRDYTLLAKMQINDGLINESKESIASALSHFRSPQAGAFQTPDRLEFVSSREDLGEQLVALLARNGNGEQALLTAEQLKEESFNNDWHRRGGQVKPDDRDIYTELTTQRAHLFAAEATDDPTAMLRDWKDWLGRFRALVADNKPLARLVAPVPTTVQEVLKAVKHSQNTLIEYLVGSDSSVAFTVEPNGRITATVLAVTRKQLEAQVTALFASPTGSVQESQKTRLLLQALYNELMPASLRNYLPKNADQMITIIPDGILFNLPFAALIDQQGRYLVEHYTMTLASSVGMFIDSPPRISEEFSMIVASAPNTSAGQAEASMITNALSGQRVTRLFGKDADLNSLQEQARGKSTVHLMNNMPMSSNPMSAVVPLVSNQDDAGRRVTASKLFASTLNNDLVVLSGTSINAKDVQGTAVKLFSRGLNYAGARNILMSLWTEPDPERTQELVEFYRNEQAGMSQAQSLRKAQLLALSRDPSPRSWAAFQLLGPGF